MGPVYNRPVLVQVMAWRPAGHKPLPEPMMSKFRDAYASPNLHELNGQYLQERYREVCRYRGFIIIKLREELWILRPLLIVAPGLWPSDAMDGLLSLGAKPLNLNRPFLQIP